MVRKFHGAVEAGRVYGPYLKDGRKPHWLWATSAISDVKRIATLFLPYLGARRASKAAELLAFEYQPRRANPYIPPCEYGAIHGYTASSYTRHYRLGEKACDACRAAWARYYKDRKRSEPLKSPST